MVALEGGAEAVDPLAAQALEKIGRRGRWRIALAPSVRPGAILHPNDLQGVLRACQVRNRRRSYPHLTLMQGEMYSLGTCVEAHTLSYPHIEVLRLYVGGMLEHHLGMPEDWLGGTPLVESADPPAPRRPYLDPVAALYLLTEIHLFAAKMASRDLLGGELDMDIELHVQAGRILDAKNKPGCFFDGGRSRTSIITLVSHRRTTPGELRSSCDDMAVAAMMRLLAAYECSAEDMEGTVRGWQDDFHAGRF